MKVGTDQLVGKSMPSLTNGKVDSRLARLWEEARHGKPATGHFSLTRDDGTQFFLSGSCSPVHDASGYLEKVVITAKEVTEDANSHYHALMLEEALNRSMAVIEFDTEGHILTANSNFLNTVGYRINDIQGQHHRMFCDEELTSSKEYSQFWKRLAAGEYISGRFKRVDSKGNVVWLQASYTPILNEDGKAERVIKFASDISARVKKNQEERASAARAHEITTSTEQIAEKGAGVVKEAATEMKKISSSVETTAQVIADLGQKSDEISSIVNTIRSEFC